MMNFETVMIGNALYVRKNGVLGELSVAQIEGGAWAILTSAIAYTRGTQEEALAFIADQMGDWYTITQAAARLVEMGAFDTSPSAQMMGIWCREGRFPGAVKVRGKGCRGGGGSWRIPASALPGFVEWRKGR